MGNNVSEYGGNSSSKTKESDAEYYARMNRESDQRTAERQRIHREEQRRKQREVVDRRDKQQREETERRRLEELAELNRRKAAEYQLKRSREELERQMRIQREEYSRNLEEQRLQAQRQREEMEYQERRRKIEEEKRANERREMEKEIERQYESDRLYRMHQLEINQRRAAAALSSSVAAAAAEEAAATERMIKKITDETEAQRQLNIRAAQLQEEMERAAIQQKSRTDEFIKDVGHSMHLTNLEFEKNKTQQVEEIRRCEREREENRLRYEEESKIRRETEENEQRERRILHEKSSEQIKRDKEAKTARHEMELEQLKEAHEARVNELLREERMKMEEIKKMKRRKEEERKLHWIRMRDAFVAMMRAHKGGMMHNEMEKKWDERFNEIRRSHDPVKEAFWDLQCIPLRKADVALSLIQFEAHLDSLRLVLFTMDEIMSTEHQQVELWKIQQRDAYFLTDYESSLDEILNVTIRVRCEIEMIVNGIEANRDNVQELDQIFRLSYLGERMMELTNAVDLIPTVYDLKRKYGHA